MLGFDAVAHLALGQVPLGAGQIAPIVILAALAYCIEQVVFLGEAFDLRAFRGLAKDILMYTAFALDIGAFASKARDKDVFAAKASESPSGQHWSGAGYMGIYEIDTEIQINGVFINAITGVYVDPTAITLFTLDPSGATVNYTFPGTIVKDSVGHYHQLITPAKSGIWSYKWQATGAAIATSPDTTFTVNASALIAG